MNSLCSLNAVDIYKHIFFFKRISTLCLLEIISVSIVRFNKVFFFYKVILRIMQNNLQQNNKNGKGGTKTSLL